MINHARTLFLNQWVGEPTAFEEYADPTFQTIQLPKWMQPARQALFGDGRAREICNFRARQVFTLLHAGNLEKYVLALDPRITYLPFLPAQRDIAPDLLSLRDVLDVLERDPEMNTYLFFYGKNTALFEEFSNLWRSPLFVDRLGGFVLAMIYKIEELRREVEGHQVLAMD